MSTSATDDKDDNPSKGDAAQSKANEAKDGGKGDPKDTGSQLKSPPVASAPTPENGSIDVPSKDGPFGGEAAGIAQFMKMYDEAKKGGDDRQISMLETMKSFGSLASIGSLGSIGDLKMDE